MARWISAGRLPYSTAIPDVVDDGSKGRNKDERSVIDGRVVNVE